MIINFEGKTYEWDQDVMVSEDAVIFAYTGLHFAGWTDALDDASNPNFVKCLQALMWMLRKRAGEMTDIKAQDFPIGKFVKAVRDAAELVAPDADDAPKEPSALEPTSV